jgi:type IX secretion system PorP/SprF family membrane protein
MRFGRVKIPFHTFFWRKTFLFIVILTKIPSIQSQDPATSHIFLPSLLQNPSWSGLKPQSGLTMNYRNQWPGLGNAFVTYRFGAGPFAAGNKFMLGATLLNDLAGKGAFSLTGMNIFYLYPIELGYRNKLVLGLQTAFYQSIIRDNGIPDVPDWASSHYSAVNGLPANTHYYPDFSASAAFAHDDISLGLQVGHLFQPDRYNTGDGLGIKRRYSLVASYRIQLQSPYSKDPGVLTPIINIDIQGNEKLIQYGAYLTKGILEPGIWIKHELFLMNYPSIILSSKINFLNLYILYSFDWIIKNNNLTFSNYGIQEVTLGYHFKYKGKRKNKGGTIICPY